MNHVCHESDKYLTNNINAVSLYNYRQVEEINTSAQYKAARAKKIGNRTLKPYQAAKNSVKRDADEAKKNEKTRKQLFNKLVKNRRIIEDEDDDIDANDIIEEVSDGAGDELDDNTK